MKVILSDFDNTRGSKLGFLQIDPWSDIIASQFLRNVFDITIVINFMLCDNSAMVSSQMKKPQYLFRMLIWKQ